MLSIFNDCNDDYNDNDDGGDDDLEKTNRLDKIYFYQILILLKSFLKISSENYSTHSNTFLKTNQII